MTGWSPVTRAAVVVVAASALVLCRDHPDGLITYDRSANGKTVTVGVGEGFDIALDSVGPGRFTTPVVSSEAVHFVSETESSCSHDCSPGGGKTQRFRFEAVETGRAEISIQLDITGWMFVLTVMVY